MKETGKFQIFKVSRERLSYTKAQNTWSLLGVNIYFLLEMFGALALKMIVVFSPWLLKMAIDLVNRMVPWLLVYSILHSYICTQTYILLIDLREKHWFVSSTYLCIHGCFLCVPWPRIEPTTLACRDNAAINWATWSELTFICFDNFCLD